MARKDLTKGSVFPTLCFFAMPMILGNILQQGYNIVDTWVVGHYAGSDALAAVGAAFALMLIFINPGESAILAEGVRYLHTVGPFYCGIGCLFLFYGLYRAIGKPGISVVLTVVSLGTRVVLAYTLAAIPTIGVAGIWWAIPIGWGLADLAGGLFYIRYGKGAGLPQRIRQSSDAVH